VTVAKFELSKLMLLGMFVKCECEISSLILYEIAIISTQMCTYSFVMESLQNGMIVSSPFLSWYTVVLWMVGGIRLDR
jgi:hypothetical protein